MRSIDGPRERGAIAHQMTDADVVSGMCPFHFDMSTLELYVAPLVQAPVVLMNEAVMRFPASFAQRSAAHRVTVWYTVPFFLRSLTERGSLDETDLSSLRLLKFAGEPYPPHALAELIALLPETTLLSNVYGPAETNGAAGNLGGTFAQLFVADHRAQKAASSKAAKHLIGDAAGNNAR